MLEDRTVKKKLLVLTCTSILLLILVNLFINILIYNKVGKQNMYSNVWGHMNCQNNSENSLFCFSNESFVNRNWIIEEERTHLSFGNVCEGGNKNLLYAVFRGGYEHGVAMNEGNRYYNLGGKLYYVLSQDGGETWSEPSCFMQPQESMDLRDPSLWWDSLFDCYYLSYTEEANDGSSYKVHLLRFPSNKGMCSFSDGIECVLPYDEMPDNSACYSPVVRVGARLYLPVYGRKTLEDNYYAELLIGNATGTKWEVLKKWNEELPDNSTECTFFTTFNDDGHLRYNMIFRGGNEDIRHKYDLNIAHYSFSDDGGCNWSDKISLGFHASGGPRVFDINGIKVLICRDQSTDVDGNNVEVAYFSSDGMNWTNRMILADDGPGYASLINNRGNGRVYYFKQYGNYCNLYSRELIKVPIIN